MEFIKRIDAESDDIVMDTAKKEYSYMLQLSALFLNFRPKWRLISMVQLITYYTIGIYFFFMLIITGATWENDMNNTSQDLHFAGFILVVLVALTEVSKKRDKFVDLLKMNANHYYKYQDGFQSKFEDKWKNNMRKMKIAVLIVLPIYYLICAVTILYLVPIIDELQGFVIDESNVNGIYTKLPVPIIVPYEVNTQALHYLTFASEILLAFLISSVLSGVILCFIFTTQDVAIQMKILRDSIINIEKRAFTLYKEIYGENGIKHYKELYKDEKFMQLINLCIKHNVEHHKIICRAFQHIYELGKWPFAVAFMVGSLVIALSLFSIVSNGIGRIATQLLSMMLLFIEILNIYLICGIGQQLTDLSEGIFYDLYNIKWIYWNESCKLSIMIFKERLKRPLKLSAAGLTPISIETFGTIMNTSYSYFNLIFAYTDADNGQNK